MIQTNHPCTHAFLPPSLSLPPFLPTYLPTYLPTHPRIHLLFFSSCKVIGDAEALRKQGRHTPLQPLGTNASRTHHSLRSSKREKDRRGRQEGKVGKHKPPFSGLLKTSDAVNKTRKMKKRKGNSRERRGKQKGTNSKRKETRQRLGCETRSGGRQEKERGIGNDIMLPARLLLV